MTAFPSKEARVQIESFHRWMIRRTTQPIPVISADNRLIMEVLMRVRTFHSYITKRRTKKEPPVPDTSFRPAVRIAPPCFLSPLS